MYRNCVLNTRRTLFVSLLIFAGFTSIYAQPTQPKLSLKAKEVSRFLDSQRYLAAEKLLNAYLPKYPKDGGLYCQYVRWLIGKHNLRGFQDLRRPILAGCPFAINYLATNASGTAVELDPSLAKYLAEIILRTLHDKINTEASAGNEVINVGSWGVGLNQFALVNLYILAIDVDPNTGKQWSGRYDSLMQRFAKRGMVGSSMSIGKIVGDLASEGQGNLGFETATKGFLLSIEATKSASVQVNRTVDLFVSLFPDQCKAAWFGQDKDII